MAIAILIAIAVVLSFMAGFAAMALIKENEEPCVIYKVPEGHWVLNGETYVCSKCGKDAYIPHTFCPHCGSLNRRMR